MSRLSRKIEIAVKSFLVVYLLRSVVVSNSESGVGSHETRCIDEERRALLKFKDNLESYNNDTLSSWSYEEEKKDCCSWDGISCDSISGHVIMLDLSHLQLSTRGKSLNPPLIELRYLNYLDLSGINLSGNNISSLIGNNMVSLQHLDLSSTQLEGSIPETFGNNMTSLSYLDLSFSYLTGPIPNSLGNMSLLAHLNLRYNGFTGSIPESFANLETLTYLDLSGNMLNGSIQIIFENMTGTLTFLALGYSGLEGHIPKSFGEKMSALAVLDLSYNHLRGSIPESFGNMVKLTYLSLEQNLLEGHIPEALGNMSILEHLDLSDNTLEGEIPKSIWDICTLRELYMPSNILSGDLPDLSLTSSSCTNHSLQMLDLRDNRIVGLFPYLSLFSSLKSLDLSSNLIGGSVHPSIGQLSQLEKLDISNNVLEGVISEAHFLKLSKLRHLNLSSNKLLIFNVSSAWVPPFRLEIISLSSCKLGPKFPNWLQTQVNYSVLEISNTGISDSIPIWFWNTSTEFQTMNASNNQISGRIANLSVLKWGNFPEVDFSSNQLEGAIPMFLFNVTTLYLSRNKFSNLNCLCDVKVRASLVLLDISFNQLSGTLPNCWSSLDSLAVLNLAHNYNLSGKLPTSIGSLLSIQALHLGNNNFTGGLPSSWKNCSSLVAFDVAENNLRGTIPSWIGESLTELAILVLRSNHFSGSIPLNICHLQSLQLLDLSVNHISGSLPMCIGNFTEMSKVGGMHATISYTISIPVPATSATIFIMRDDKIEFVWKGILSEFGRTLGLVKSIDLSCNMLNGDIPSKITLLVGLVSLNLSRNNLSGHIPARIGNMRSLDFLDLSNNHLLGRIPQGLSLIDGMGVLNLSNNNLFGKIPTSSTSKLQSFDASAYMGNPGLCGDPLSNKCPGEELTTPPRFIEEAGNGEDTDKFISHGFYASMGIGYAVGFWGVLGTLIFNKSWRFSYLNFLNDFANWIHVFAAVRKAKFLRTLRGL
ncbi:receptor-like protein EIX2 [Ziziphus jujuba]|uniref:Receptor-like protein EIX2 n=1 Tax=Ziziphus jujuba TaxID=326968 RepID=A0A6P4BCC6_ZIZJJ|nr:receptor-like protein EIX2 [Ziziphus jujuba]